jgi:DNA anti-recombination protein RmuC
MNRSSTDPLGARPDDPLEKWRAAAEQREREFAHERAKEKREEQRAVNTRAANEAAQIRNAFERRLAAVEQSNQELHENFGEMARALAETLDLLIDKIVALLNKPRDEVRELQTEIANLRTALAEARGQKAEFRFARERESSAEDLPDFLPRKMN